MTCSARAENLFIDYSIKPKLAKLTVPTLCIVDPNAQIDLKTAHERGHTVLAYLSVVELAHSSLTNVVAVRRGVPLLGTNDQWKSRVMDILDPRWAAFVVDDCAAKAVGMGFDGFFLDTLDSLERVAGNDPSKLAACRQAIVDLVKTLDQRWPRAKIVVNRGFALLPLLHLHMDGLLVESVYQTFEPAHPHTRYRATDPAGVTWIENQIRAAQKLKLPVYAVDYVNPMERDLARTTADRLKALGCVPLVTTQYLTGDVLAP